MTFLDEVYSFNQQANLLTGYNDKLESSFQIEEALEGLSDLGCLATTFGTTNASPKHLSRLIVGLSHSDAKPASDLDRLDKAIDAIVFALGSIYKLGLTPEQASRAISCVTNANLAKLGMPKDEQGKLTKPADFTPPDIALQQILDERSL